MENFTKKMSSEKKNLCEKEISSADKNYQLNMEILSSLKSIPGKIVNLQSGNFINDEFNKRLINPEGKKTTSSSISKLSKDFFYEQIDDKALNKKINTTYSVFRPMTLFPNKRSTMNYFPFNTLMSFPDIYLQNPINNAPPKITNSSYSKNSFCAMPPNMEQNINLYNQINLTGNQMNTLTQINQINPFNFFGTNPFNSFNTLNLINPNVNMAPQNQLNELYLSKNNLNNNINNTINNNQKKNILLNKKRNADENIEENVISSKKNLFKINNKKQKIDYLNTNNNSNENNNKKNLFIVIPKSSYNYKKRKPRKRKLFNGIKKKLICNHYGCDGIFKTKKQLLFHHYKMNPQCHNDTVLILKMINFAKTILKKDNLEKNKERFSELYKETMEKVSLDEHIETLVGYNFEDEVIEDKNE